MTRTLRLPSADELDTAAQRDDYRVALYLAPAEETADGVAAIVMHAGVGTIGQPAPAYEGRWIYVGSYGAKTVGASVREVLESLEPSLLSAASADCDGLELHDQWDSADLRHYWSADEWFGPAGIAWPELCAEASIDPDRALSCDPGQLADEIAAALTPLQDEHVYGIADYARDQIESFVAAQEAE